MRSLTFQLTIEGIKQHYFKYHSCFSQCFSCSLKWSLLMFLCDSGSRYRKRSPIFVRWQTQTCPYYLSKLDAWCRLLSFLLDQSYCTEQKSPAVQGRFYHTGPRQHHQQWETNWRWPPSLLARMPGCCLVDMIPEFVHVPGWSRQMPCCLKS